MIVNARRVTPAEAADLGLAQRVVDPADFEDEVRTYAALIADGPARAHAAAKQAVTDGMEMSLDQGLAYEQQLEYDLFGTEGFRDGISAFVDDREPEFRGE